MLRIRSESRGRAEKRVAVATWSIPSCRLPLIRGSRQSDLAERSACLYIYKQTCRDLLCVRLAVNHPPWTLPSLAQPFLLRLHHCCYRWLPTSNLHLLWGTIGQPLWMMLEELNFSDGRSESLRWPLVLSDLKASPHS